MFNFTVTTDLAVSDHPGDRSPEGILKRLLAACAESRRASALEGTDGADEASDAQIARTLDAHDEARKALTGLIDDAPAGLGELPDISWSAEPGGDEFTHRFAYIDGLFIGHVSRGADRLTGFDPAPILARAGFKIVPM